MQVKFAVVVSLLLALYCLPGLTQENALPAEAPPTCVPECRSGYMCFKGTCISKCNPVCPQGEFCSTDGNCIASQTQPPTALQTSGATSSPVSNQPNISPEDGRALYYKSRRRKTVGTIMMITGIVGIVGAGVLAALSVLEDEEWLIFPAAGLEILSVGLFVPGLILTIKGGKGKRRYRPYVGLPPTSALVAQSDAVMLLSPGALNLFF